MHRRGDGLDQPCGAVEDDDRRGAFVAATPVIRMFCVGWPRARGGPLRSCPPPSTKQAWRSAPPLLRCGATPCPRPSVQRRRSGRRSEDRGGGALCGAKH
jgi:hypothetical protein